MARTELVPAERNTNVHSDSKPQQDSHRPIQPKFPNGDAMAWIAKAANQPMVLETVDLGPLGAEDVEVLVEHCGLCHSDLSVLNNDWGFRSTPRFSATSSSAGSRQ